MAIKDLHSKGIIIEILNMGRADDTPMGRLMITMLLAFAEFEHDNIIERLNTGKAIKKANGGKTDGRNRLEKPDLQKFLQKQKDGKLTVNECCAELGISRSTWYNRVREVAR